MPGSSKRKRKAPPVAAASSTKEEKEEEKDSKPAAARKTKSIPEESSFLVTLYNLVRQLDKNVLADSKDDVSLQKQKQSAASALFLGNKAWALVAPSSSVDKAGDDAKSLTLPPEQAYCFALVFVTHVLHRLTTACAEQQQEGETDEPTAQVLAGWARWLMTRLERLVPSYSKWDKATGAARHALARMITTITGACLAGLTTTTNDTTDASTLVAATLTLEQALLNMGKYLPVFGQGNEFLTDASAEDLEQFSLTENPSKMVDASLRVNRLLVECVQLPTKADGSSSCPFWDSFTEANAQIDTCEWTATEWAVLNCLTQTTDTAAAETKSNKKRGRRQDNTDSTALSWIGLWETFCREHKTCLTALDGRLPARRWAPVMMDWYLQAGPRLIAKAQVILSNDASFDDMTNKDGWTIPGQVVPVLLTGRWARILAESASRSGPRSPSIGGFESYVKPFVPVGLRPKGKSTKKLAKPDVRDIAMVTIHALLEAHARCLNLDVGYGLPFCLWIPDIIRHMASATSAVLSASESAECADRLEHAAAAYIPTFSDGTTNHDWVLLYYGLTKFDQALAFTKNDTTNAVPIHFESSMLETPGELPTPNSLSLKPVSKKKKTESVKKWCSYAGVYPKAEAGKASLEKIAVHLRGYGISSKSKQSKQAQAPGATVEENTITRLFTLAERSINVSVRPAATKKGKGKATASSRPNKRRRKETSISPTTGANETLEFNQNKKNGPKSVMSVVRAKLISKILHILDANVAVRYSALCLLRKPLPSTESLSLPKVISILFEFNYKVHNTLFTGRSFGKTMNESSSLLGGEAAIIPSNAKIVASHESELWSSLMSLNATLGAGRQDNISTESKHETILGSHRLEIYKCLAGAGTRNPPKENWPLWMPTPSRVFLSCNLCAENMSGAKIDISPDQFILQRFLKSLDGILADPTDLVQGSSAETSICVEEEVPLSLLDARVVVGACARLPPFNRMDFLSSILDCVNEHIKKLVDGHPSKLVVEREVSEFIGRVVSTVTHLVTLVGCNDGYHRFIQKSLSDSFSRRLTKWLSTDKHVPYKSFMGLLSNFEHTDLPDGARPNESLPGTIFPRFQKLIEISFELGFRSVSFDNGYLLYAAWNAHGRLSLWAPVLDRLAISSMSLENPPSAILAIRSDLCLVHRRIRSDQGVLAKTYIAKCLDRSLGASSPRTIVDNLKTLIEKGSEMVLKLLDNQGVTERSTITMESCALLQSLCVCISFGITSLTVAESNFFSDLTAKHTRRPRGYSTDSVDSDVDSTCSNDARVNASERLAEVCRAAGAVPAHPDWLDSTCSFRYGITRTEARILATRAIKAFTSLVKSGRKARSNHVAQVVDNSSRESSSSQVFLQSTSLLFSLSGSAELADGGILEIISSLCKTSEETANMLVCGLSTGLQTSTSDIWCPNASQQIIGEMHGLIQDQLILPSEIGFSELRATGDWEIALATSLLSGLFDIEANTNLNVLATSRWTSMISSALEWMVPAFALMRFTLQTGAMSHPLKSLTYSVEEYVAQEDDLLESVFASTRLIGTQRESVLETIDIFTNPLTSKEKVSHALAYHVLGNTRESRCLNYVGKVVASLRIFAAFVNQSADESCLKSLVSNIVACLKESVVTGSPEYTLARLIFACAHRTKLEVGSLSLGKLSVTDVVVSELKVWSSCVNYNGDALHFASDAVSALVSILLRPSSLSRDSMVYLCSVLSSIAIIERQEGVDPKLSRFIMKSLSKNPGSVFQDIVASDRKFQEDDADLLLDLSNICASPFFSRVSEGLSVFSTNLYQSLRGAVNSCNKGEIPVGILNLWFLCGTHCGKLDEIGTELFSRLSSSDKVDAAHTFVTFVTSLSSALSSGKASTSTRQDTGDNPEGRLCSFIVKEGFQEQYWYNCRTCGLSGEKGCCSTCARICHRGHDVVYARHSSFFCDCGAESSKPLAEVSTRLCKCLSPTEQENDCLLISIAKPKLLSESSHNVGNAFACAQIAASLFKDKSQKSLRRVRTCVGKNNWLSKMSAALSETIDDWRLSRGVFDEERLLAPRAISKALSSSCTGLDGFTALHSSKLGIFNSLPTGDGTRGGRSILAADGRGRLVLCEGPRLRLWGLSSMMNDSFANDNMDFALSDIPLSASTAHDLKDVVGIQLSADNGYHLLIWSQKEASAFVIQPMWNGVRSRVQILSEEEMSGETIAKCAWLSGIEGFACVGLRDRVQIHRLTESCTFTTIDVRHNQATSALLKDYAIVPIFEGYNVVAWKVFCLLEKGGLLQASFRRVDLFGEKTELTLETHGSLALPNSVEDDVGERLDFLGKGGLLICQMSKSGTCGMRIENGEVKRSFSLLPACPLTLPEEAEFMGPYTHWHSLQTDGGDNQVHPVVSLFCCGRSKDSTQSTVLQIVLGDSLEIKAWEGFVRGVIAGMALCSFPMVENESNPFDMSAKRVISERGVLSFVTSTGDFISLIEREYDPDQFSHIREDYPVLIFEKLERISRPEQLTFQVDGISDDINARLLKDSDEFLVSPRPEGFTINIGLTNSRKQDEESLAIAALRVQVGRVTTARIPSRIFVEGRKIALKKGTSDWYAAVLTAQEIASTVRKGFVTVKVDTCLSGSTPVIDALEVYGTRRSLIASWMTAEQNQGHRNRSSSREQMNAERILLGIESLCKLKDIGTEKAKGSLETEQMRTLVYETAFAGNSKVSERIVDLVTAFERSIGGSWQIFLDDTRVAACSDFVTGTPPEMGVTDIGGTSYVQGQQFLCRLEECLRVSCDIAKNRPNGYLKAIEKTHRKQRSIALPASLLLENASLCHIATDTVVTQLTELCLIEMAISFLQGKKLDNVLALQRLLRSKNTRILGATCRAVKLFCRMFQSPHLLRYPDPFATQAMVAVYGCDSCAACPIQGTRYTLAKDDTSFDLCENCYSSAAKFASSNRNRSGDVLVNGKPIGDDSTKLSCAEVKIMQPIHDHQHSHPRSVAGETGEVVHRQQVYDDFLGNLLLGVLGLLSDEMKSRGVIETDLIQLVTDLANLSEKSCRPERKKRVVKRIAEALSELLSLSDPSGRVLQCIVACLDTLSQLIIADSEAREFYSSPHSTTVEPFKADISCDTHHCAIELRQFRVKGDEHKKFMTCKSDRCGLFSWVSSTPEDTAASLTSVFDKEASRHIWEHLTAKSQASSVADRLCTMVKKLESKDIENLSDTGASTFSPSTTEQTMNDLLDGVLSGLARIQHVCASEIIQAGSVPKQTKNLTDTALELLSLSSPVRMESLPCWHPVLCKMIGSEQASTRKDLAKTTLYRLCGANHEAYHRVRDRFALSAQIRKLSKHSESLISRALVIKEKAHVCGQDWRQEFNPENRSGLDFLGVKELLTEDTLSRVDDEAIRSILEDTLSIAKRRSQNWQAFSCAAPEELKRDNIRASPLSAILSLCVLLGGDSQLKALKLCELASPHAGLLKQGRRQSSPRRSTQQSIFPFGSFSASEVLLAFSDKVVLNGSSSEIRRVGCSVANQMSRHASNEAIRQMFPKGMVLLEKSIAEFGKNGIEYIAFLASVAQELKGDTNLAEYSSAVEDFVLRQMSTLRHHRANEDFLIFETRSSSTPRKRFDLGFCLHCSRPHSSLPHGIKRGEDRSKTSVSARMGEAASSRRSSRSAGQRDSSKVDWIEGQVSPFSRTRLHSLRESHASDEFSTYIELKNRLVISEFSVEIHDARGRLVKSITAYSTPRPVNDARELMSDSYIHKWQMLGAIQLSRGASRGSIVLPKPMIAANLRIEYTDFYDRPGDSSQSDKAFVMHCPRCSRIVNNAAGVCSCGEVVYQCRKCRHVNYGRLDAFLCTECGYCASGNFSFDIIAATATNAEAITNDVEYKRFHTMLAACTRIREDTRFLLKEKHLSAVKALKKTEKDRDSDFWSEDLCRVYNGQVPQIPWQKNEHLFTLMENLGKQGSVVRAVARPQNLEMAGIGSTDRRSTLNALQRSGSGSSSSRDRRHADDIVVQQIRAEIDEDESEILGLLEGSGRAGALESDPISRLLARVRSRHEQSENDHQDEGAGAASPAGGTKTKTSTTTKECLEICERLHLLMREAEREAYELRRQIRAWESLNRNDLAGVKSHDESYGFSPCRCLNCSSAVASGLLSLWQHLFQSDPATVKPSEALVEVLLQNDVSWASSSSRSLQDSKRLAVESIATQSSAGAQLVLNSLRRRLGVGHDVYAAELLGRILESSVPSPLQSEFVHLAAKQLEQQEHALSPQSLG